MASAGKTTNIFNYGPQVWRIGDHLALELVDVPMHRAQPLIRLATPSEIRERSTNLFGVAMAEITPGHEGPVRMPRDETDEITPQQVGIIPTHFPTQEASDQYFADRRREWYDEGGWKKDPPVATTPIRSPVTDLLPIEEVRAEMKRMEAAKAEGIARLKAVEAEAATAKEMQDLLTEGKGVHTRLVFDRVLDAFVVHTVDLTHRIRDVAGTDDAALPAFGDDDDDDDDMPDLEIGHMEEMKMDMLSRTQWQVVALRNLERIFGRLPRFHRYEQPVSRSGKRRVRQQRKTKKAHDRRNERLVSRIRQQANERESYGIHRMAESYMAVQKARARLHERVFATA